MNGCITTAGTHSTSLRVGDAGENKEPGFRLVYQRAGKHLECLPHVLSLMLLLLLPQPVELSSAAYARYLTTLHSLGEL